MKSVFTRSVATVLVSMFAACAPTTEETSTAPTRGIPAASVASVVRSHAAAWHQCDATVRAVQPDYEASVVMSFQIDAEGRVRETPTLTGAEAVPALAACLTTEAATMVFPAPAGGAPVSVRYPLQFRP